MPSEASNYWAMSSTQRATATTLYVLLPPLFHTRLLKNIIVCPRSTATRNQRQQASQLTNFLKLGLENNAFGARVNKCNLSPFFRQWPMTGITSRNNTSGDTLVPKCFIFSKNDPSYSATPRRFHSLPLGTE